MLPELPYIVNAYSNPYKDKPVVYGLIDPRTDEIRYVGKSLKGTKRAFQHQADCSLARDGNTRKANWIRSLKKQGLVPKIIVLLSLDSIEDKVSLNLELYKKEQELIDLHKSTLTNHQDGGPGSPGRIWSEESKRKSSESHKKLPLPKALLDNQKPRANKIKKVYKQKSRSVPGKKESYYNSMKQVVYAKDIKTNKITIHSGLRDAAKLLGGKANKTGIRLALNHKKPYYGYFWSLECL